MHSICLKCDIFIGFGGSGVIEKPVDKDINWLKSHCWGCGRSSEEINRIQNNYLEAVEDYVKSVEEA